MSLFTLSKDINTILKKLPSVPGVYLFRDDKYVLYIGRATSIKNRVASYFTGKDSRGERIFQMVDRAQSIEVIETETVLESVILEANLIKKYQPKYNIELKDDKSFSYFVVTKEDFPRILIVRERDLIMASLGGGKEDTSSILARKVFSLRGARVGNMYGPYVSKYYMETVLKILRRIFPFHSNIQNTEDGCLYRQIGMCPGPYDGGITKDLYRKNIRNIEYVLRGQKKRLLSALEREMQKSAKKEDFERAKHLKDQVFALRHIRDVALITNKKEDLGSYSSSHVSNMTRKVSRVEAYDISHISGQHAVASMVVFKNGEPQKSAYRKFKIQSVEGINDVAMMREVLARRIRHSEWTTPDMIVLDGGKGHLNMAISLWKALNTRIPVIAIAKGPTRKKVDIYTHPEFMPLPRLLADKVLLECIREEAHRFAITYHRKLRGKAFLL